MSLNHHILAKTTTDSVLRKFKEAAWEYANGKGKDFYRVGTNASFPSPDAAFYDPTNNVIAAFEFKPPTETKRGILTGIGQSIAYLQSSNISFLVAPNRLGDYDLGGYLRDLYSNHIEENLPTGLILYDNNSPADVTLAHGISSISGNANKKHVPESDRFWAKHQDLPVPLFHLILHYYYSDRINRTEEGDPFASCFKKEFISETVLQDFQPKDCILDLSRMPIKTVAGSKNIVHLEKKLNKAREEAKCNPTAAIESVRKDIDTEYVGDNYYNSIKKNYLSFMKHIQVIDSENKMTDSGFSLYHIGLVNGPTSRVFLDYFAREVLTTGHHLDLILDIDALKQKNSSWTIDQVLKQMESDYENKGYIRRNPNRKQAAESKVNFLKYERILWNSLGLVDNNGTIQWKRITEICSLPELRL